MRLAVLLAGAVSLAAIASACSAPDPGKITFAEDLGEPRTPTGTGGGAKDGGGAGTGDGTGTGTGTGNGDGTGGAPMNTNDPLFGPDPFKPGQTPATGAVAAHGLKQAAGAPQGEAIPDCGACHKAGGPAATAPFVYYGKAVLGGAPAAGAEVVVTGTDNKPFLTNVDQNGFFWLIGADPFPAGAQSAIRTADKISKMPSSASSGGCMQAACHGAADKPIDFVGGK